VETKEEVFEGVIIDGKRFPFKYLSMTQAMQVHRKLIPGFWRGLGILAKTVITPWNDKKRWWKRVRSVAFQKQGLWRIGIVPYELRCSVIKPEKAEEAEAAFFATVPEIVRESEKLLELQKALLIRNNNKSEAL
jgi:hypothetical protein